MTNNHCGQEIVAIVSVNLKYIQTSKLYTFIMHEIINVVYTNYKPTFYMPSHCGVSAHVQHIVLVKTQHNVGD